MSSARRCKAERRKIGILASLVVGLKFAESSLGDFDGLCPLASPCVVASAVSSASGGDALAFDAGCKVGTDSTCNRSIMPVNKSVAQGRTARGLVLVHKASNETADVRNVVGKCDERITAISEGAIWSTASR